MLYYFSITLLLFTGYAALMVYYFKGWIKTKTFEPADSFSPSTKISVIVAARNEERYIGDCLNSLLNQDYPQHLFEIIVVDDYSEDNTLNVIHQINDIHQKKNKKVQLKIISLQDASSIPDKNIISYKKLAIQQAIEAATGTLIVTTDADCVAGEKWILTIAAYYETYHPKMLAGPVKFCKTTTWLERWQALDLCGMMAITAGAISNRFPNMCNGANLAYEKKAFEEVNGFSGIDNHPGGDDVMLMLKISKKKPGSIHFLRSQNAIVQTQPVNTFSELFQQRLRWLSKGTAFSDWRVSAVLVFSYFFNVTLLLGFIAGFIEPWFWYYSLLFFLLKTIVEFPLLMVGSSFFNQKFLLAHLLSAQVFHILYVVVIGGLSKLTGFQWKGRKFPASAGARGSS